jgi:hypothetical protein
MFPVRGFSLLIFSVTKRCRYPTYRFQANELSVLSVTSGHLHILRAVWRSSGPMARRETTIPSTRGVARLILHRQEGCTHLKCCLVLWEGQELGLESGDPGYVCALPTLLYSLSVLSIVTAWSPWQVEGD